MNCGGVFVEGFGSVFVCVGVASTLAYIHTYQQAPGNVATQGAGPQEEALGVCNGGEVEGGEDAPAHQLQIQVHRGFC